MKTTVFAAALAILLLAGCANSSPPIPAVHYPVTYSVPVTPPISPKLAPSEGSSQDVYVEPGKPLYFEISSPVALTVYYYEKVGASPNGNLLGHAVVPAGAPITAEIVPPTSAVEFVFDASGPNATGTLQFTVSDAPIPEAVARSAASTNATFLGH